MAEQKESGGPASGLSSATEYVQIFMINVTINKATDLKKADLMGKSDPYLRVTASGQTYTTKTIMKTLDPVWDEKTTFVFFADPGKLDFEVWDWDRGTKDDSLGKCELSLNGFFTENHKGFTGQIPLTDVKKPKGEIHVSVTCRKLVPSDLENRAKTLAFETEQQKEQLVQLQESINNTKVENEQLTNENTSLTTKIAEVKVNVEETEKDIEARTQTQNELKQELEEAEKAKEGANEKLEAARGEMKELETEVTKLKDELDRARNDNENLEAESAELERQLMEKKEQKGDGNTKHKQEDSTQQLIGDGDDAIDVAPPKTKGCCIVM